MNPQFFSAVMRNTIVMTLFALAALGFLLMQFIAFTGEFDNIPELPDTRIVTKVIDGDTIIVSGGDTVRLLGIDTDEKGQPCYTAAKERLYALLINQKVVLEKETEDTDLYGRLLRYVFLDSNNMNVQMIEEGLAVARLYAENERYASEIRLAEQTAIQQKIGCKWNKKAH